MQKVINEAKIHSPIHSAFEALVVRHLVSHCYGEGLNTFFLPIPAAGVAVFSAYYPFPELASQM